jgi:hypothetical protein
MYLHNSELLTYAIGEIVAFLADESKIFSRLQVSLAVIRQRVPRPAFSNERAELIGRIIASTFANWLLLRKMASPR